jgi:signal transduction histidine kinase
VILRVLLQPGVLVVEIEDDGRGIPEEKRSTGQDGLSNIHTRMAQIGGCCEMLSGDSGKGTLVRFILPLTGRTHK